MPHDATKVFTSQHNTASTCATPLASHLKFFTKCFSPSYMCFCPWGGFMMEKMVVLSRMHPLPKLLHVLPGLPCQAVDWATKCLNHHKQHNFGTAGHGNLGLGEELESVQSWQNMLVLMASNSSVQAAIASAYYKACCFSCQNVESKIVVLAVLWYPLRRSCIIGGKWRQYVRIYIYIWTAEIIWYKMQLTGCSYLVLQSRQCFGVWPRSPMPHLFLIAKCSPDDAYLVLGVFLPRFTA